MGTYPVHGDDRPLPVSVLQGLGVQLKARSGNDQRPWDPSRGPARQKPAPLLLHTYSHPGQHLHPGPRGPPAGRGPAGPLGPREPSCSRPLSSGARGHPVCEVVTARGPAPCSSLRPVQMGAEVHAGSSGAGGPPAPPSALTDATCTQPGGVVGLSEDSGSPISQRTAWGQSHPQVRDTAPTPACAAVWLWGLVPRRGLPLGEACGLESGPEGATVQLRITTPGTRGAGLQGSAV